MHAVSIANQVQVVLRYNDPDAEACRSALTATLQKPTFIPMQLRVMGMQSGNSHMPSKCFIQTSICPASLPSKSSSAV